VADNPMVIMPVESAAAVGFSILMVPLADTLRVFTIRIFHGKSPFSPDRRHIHHLLLDRGLNHKYVTLSCLVMNILFIAIAYYGRGLGPTFTLLTLVGVATVLLTGLIYIKKPVVKAVHQHMHHENAEKEVHAITKVVPINTESVAIKN